MFRFRRPRLSVVVVIYRMRRVAQRTLFSLSAQYQRNVSEGDYEVVVVENLSDEMLSAEFVEQFGPQFRYFRNQRATSSPAAAINLGAQRARGRYLTLMVDGARILSPGVLAFSQMASKLHRDPIVATLGWHLGPKNQAISIKEGYGPETEDELLRTAEWQRDGYQLFSIAVLAASSAGGWFAPLAESNCLTLSKQRFHALGGYCERFTASGGGFVNLDFYRRAIVSEGSQLYVLLGEGSFHQVHGGAATNRKSDSILTEFSDEYERIRGHSYQAVSPGSGPIYFGTVPQSSAACLYQSAERILSVATANRMRKAA